MFTLHVALYLFVGIVSATAPEQIPGYNIIWSDSFDGPGLDTSKWSIYTGAVFNAEQETYTTSSNNCGPSGSGSLLITPLKDTDTQNWTSCKLESQPAFAAVPGGKLTVQAHLKLGTPGAPLQGIWPAFWSLGQSMRTGTAWPQCGEIDTFENVNGGAIGYGTLHCPECQKPTGLSSGVTFDYGTFHTWSHTIDLSNPDWTAQSITWYQDSQPYRVVEGADLGDNDAWNTMAVQSMFLILNVAVGGAWPGGAAADTATRRDSGMEVAYVAVYQST